MWILFSLLYHFYTFLTNFENYSVFDTKCKYLLKKSLGTLTNGFYRPSKTTIIESCIPHLFVTFSPNVFTPSNFTRPFKNLISFWFGKICSWNNFVDVDTGKSNTQSFPFLDSFIALITNASFSF